MFRSGSPTPTTTSTHPSLLAGVNASASNEIPVFDPLVAPLSIAPFKLRLDSIVLDTVFDAPNAAQQPPHSAPSQPQVLDCELYPLSWVVFQPNIIIDAKVGVLWLVRFFSCSKFFILFLLLNYLFSNY